MTIAAPTPVRSKAHASCSADVRGTMVAPRWVRPAPCQRRGRCAVASARRATVWVAAFTETAPPVAAAGSQPASVSLLSNSSIDNGKSSERQLATKLSWAGAGIFFFWQLGAMRFLAERYDLTKVPMVGASGGALASVLAACGVPADLVLKRAYELSVKHNIWERPLGLLGVWGSLIEQWLDDLLPDDAAERCRGRITMVVTTLPTMAQEGISDFTDKKDLINVAMASSHIPIFLDMKFARYCRGKYCVDGSFPDFFYNANCDLLKADGAAIIFDYFDDKNIKRKGRMDMLEVKTYEEVQHIMELGYQYAAKLHSQGHFDHFEMTGLSIDDMAEYELQEGGGNGGNGAKGSSTQRQQAARKQKQRLVPAVEGC